MSLNYFETKPDTERTADLSGAVHCSEQAFCTWANCPGTTAGPTQVKNSWCGVAGFENLHNDYVMDLEVDLE